MTVPGSATVAPRGAGRGLGGTGVGALRVRIHRHIAEIPPAEWDALVPPEEIQMSHRFIRVCQEAGVENASYRHVVIEDGAGPCAIASLSAMRVRLDLLAPRAARLPIRIARGVSRSLLVVPVLFCGLPVSFGRPCLRFRARPPLSDRLRAAVVGVLAEVMEDAGSELGARVLCFKEFAPAEAAEVVDLRAHGYFRSASLPSYRLAIRWRSMSEYLAAMRAGYRRQLLRARAVAHSAGVSYRVVGDFGAACPEIFRLYEQVMSRAQFQLEQLNLAFFAGLNAGLGAASRAILAERDGELVSAAILLEAGGHVAFLLAGIDYARNRGSAAYVNLVAEVVGEAIRGGATTLELGQTSAALKTRLGAEESPRDLYIRGVNSGLDRLLRLAAPVLFPSRQAAARRVFRPA